MYLCNLAVTYVLVRNVSRSLEVGKHETEYIFRKCSDTSSRKRSKANIIQAHPHVVMCLGRASFSTSRQMNRLKMRSPSWIIADLQLLHMGLPRRYLDSKVSICRFSVCPKHVIPYIASFFIQ